MEIKFRIMILFLICVLLCGGCTPVVDEPVRVDLTGSIQRFYDHEAGVVCWIYNSYNRSGISCLPMDQTNLFIYQ